jgi:hypothetical protein
MHPATRQALSQLQITTGSLPQQQLGRLQGHQGIDRGINGVDVSKIGTHHFKAGIIPPMDGMRQFKCIHGDNRVKRSATSQHVDSREENENCCPCLPSGDA